MTEPKPEEFTNLIGSPSDNTSQPNDPKTILLRQKIDGWLRLTFNITQLIELVESINSDDRSSQHFGVIGIRHLLSTHNPPVQAVIDANLVPKLIEFVKNDNEPHLQLESIWALTNIASGTTEQTRVIINNGGIHSFVKLLRSPVELIAEQAIWAIGNISGDSVVFRDMILKEGGLEPLIEIVDQSTNDAIIKHGTWAISNLCRGKPLPKIEMVKSAIPVLCKIVQQDNRDIETLTDAVWALSYSSGSEPGFDQELSIGILPVLLKYLDHTHLSLAVPCLRTLGNITQDHTIQNAALANPIYLPKLMKLTCHNRKALRRESCWNLSNLTAGDSNQIEAFIKHHHYVDMIITLATKDIVDVKREAVYILLNAIKHCNMKQRTFLIELGVLDCLLNNLSSVDKEIVEIALSGLNVLLIADSIVYDKKEKTEREVLDTFLAKRGLQKLVKLDFHPVEEIRLLAARIVQTHFEGRLKNLA